MACCEGSEIQYEDIMPPELQDVRKMQANIAKMKLSQGATATPYTGPLVSAPDPASLAATNMVMGLGGYNPYQMPSAISSSGALPPASWQGLNTQGFRGDPTEENIRPTSRSKFGPRSTLTSITKRQLQGPRSGR